MPSYTPIVPSKTLPYSRPKWVKCFAFLDQDGAKTPPDGAAHTYIAYIREYLPPPGGNGEEALVGRGQLYCQASLHVLIVSLHNRMQEEENGKTLVRDKHDRAIILVSFVVIFP